MFKRETLTICEVEAALCMWEHILHNVPTYQDHLDGVGYAALRHASMQAGLIAHEVYELLEAQGHEYCTSYNWEFVPDIAGMIDWTILIEDNQYGGPAYEPDLTAFANRVLLKQPNNFASETINQSDNWLDQARAAAKQLWAYPELIDDHIEKAHDAFHLGEDAAKFAKTLGEKYDLIPAR